MSGLSVDMRFGVTSGENFVDVAEGNRPFFALQAVLLKEKDAARMALISRDCSRLMPDGSPEAAARLAELHAERAAVELERAEALAKHRLYELLEARTKYTFL